MVFLSMSADRLIPVIGEAMKQAGSWREYGGHKQEVLISQLLGEIETKFQMLNPHC